MKTLSQKIQSQFDLMSKTGKLFRVSLTGQEVWDLYLSSFDVADNPTFRDPESSEHNCNHCKNFIRRYGNIVSVSDNFEIVSMFDIEIDGEYNKPMKALSKKIQASTIKDVFFETFQELNSLPYESCKISNSVFKLGIPYNTKQYSREEAEKFGVVKAGEIKTFNHFHLNLSKDFVDMSNKSVASIMGEYRDMQSVFKRALDEISIDTLKLVKDLIIQNSLLDGQTHLFKIEQFIPFKEVYDTLSEKQKANWAWVTSFKLPIAKFKNELIGVLCSELAEGKEINAACQSWNKRVDPVNYMKAKAPISQRQIDDAKAFIEENGYVESFDRRFATIDDIKISEIKHINVGDGEVKKLSIFDGVKSNKTQHKRNQFDGIEEVGIEKFMKDILPSCTGVEVFLQNDHSGNMVNLTTSKNEDSKPMFKWNNNYSWTFNGNLAGKSQIKEAVKSQGGKIDGVLRFSIMWAQDDIDNSDLDAHCHQPNGNLIYFSNKRDYNTGGNLDIDITNPKAHKSHYKKDVVENITFPQLSQMVDGKYVFLVHQFSANGSQGFKAEIEFNGETYTYSYDKPLTYKSKVIVAEVTLKDGVFSIEHKIPESGVSSKEIYGLETNKFHKVNLVCLSPNHWNDNNVGNKHYLFMLDGCKATSAIRSFHNENLLPELAEHRKVLEVLGATNMIEPTDGPQLAGLGFNATVKDELIVKLSGNFKRTIKLRF